jgi:hypothetical protein
VSAPLEEPLARYAVFSTVHAVVVLGALFGVLGPHDWLVVLIASVPLLFAWGAFQADVAMNPVLDERDRNRWRILLWLLPWSMAAYWHRYVRPRKAYD